MPLYPRLCAFSTSACALFQRVWFPSCVVDFYPREAGDFGFAPAPSADLDGTTPLEGEN